MPDSFLSLWHGEIVRSSVVPFGRVETIKRWVADKHEVTVADLEGPRTTRRISRARHEAMYELLKRTRLSSVAVGRRLGGRDHSTVLHGCKRHADRLAEAQG